MTDNSLFPSSLSTAIIRKRATVGAVIGLILISLFIFGANGADPAWGKFWMIRPLIIVPIAAAMGAIFHYYIQHLFWSNGWNKALAVIIGIFGFIVALWLGTVLGLDGTYWD